MKKEWFDRLVVVSNRLPIVLHWSDSGCKVEPGSGGLVTALAPVLSEKNGLWIGWPGNVLPEQVQDSLKDFGQRQGYHLQPVFIDPEDIKGYYYGFSNEILWPLLHGFLNRWNCDPAYWPKYRKVNEMFAREIINSTTPEDYIWIHDYHLMCVGQAIKASGEKRDCGFFLHVPFPGPEIFLKCPWREKILRALLDYDLLGFQTHVDMKNFIHCLEYLCSDIEQEWRESLAVVKCGQFQVKAGGFPISIDFEEFAGSVASKEISRRTTSINLLHPDQQLIVGVDRLDYTKGIPQRLDALRNVLTNYPDLRGKISLLQIVVPSREEVYEYQLLKEEIERLVGEINGQFTEPGWIPIHYLYRSLSRQELISFYLAAEIALITPLWDGMNLVAKEYCACNYLEDGVLILSEFAGAATQLHQGALLVNPYDVDGMANAVRKAYYMPKSERKSRMQKLRSIIKDYDIHFWLDSFLGAAFEDKAIGYPMGNYKTFLPKIDKQ